MSHASLHTLFLARGGVRGGAISAGTASLPQRAPQFDRINAGSHQYIDIVNARSCELAQGLSRGVW
jgi:hypothetical protein